MPGGPARWGPRLDRAFLKTHRYFSNQHFLHHNVPVWALKYRSPSTKRRASRFLAIVVRTRSHFYWRVRAAPVTIRAQRSPLFPNTSLEPAPSPGRNGSPRLVAACICAITAVVHRHIPSRRRCSRRTDLPVAFLRVVDPQVYVVMVLQSCSKCQRRCTTSSTSVAFFLSHRGPGNIVLGAEGAASNGGPP